MATGRFVDFSPLILDSCSSFVGRRWLLDRVRSFINEPNEPRSIILVGDPGAGKTTLLAQVVSDTGAAHFFCGRSDGISAENGGGWSEPIRCAETLGTQLVRTYGPEIVDWSRFGLEVRIHAESVYGQLTGAAVNTLQAGPRPSGRPIIDIDVQIGAIGAGGFVTGLSIQELRVDAMLALQELFLGPLRRAALNYPGNVIVVLDGLDEWDRQSCSLDVFEILQRSALPHNIKIIASARPSYISRLLPNTVAIDISDFAMQPRFDDDVTQLVDASLTERGITLNPRSRAILVSKAGGNFLYASYLLETLDSESPESALEKQPSRLEAFYRQEMAKLVDQFAREGVRDSLGPLLAVVCSAREPIDSWTAAQAADMSKDIATDVLERMRTFVRPMDTAGVLRYAPFHLSFSEFVLSGRAGIGIEPQTGHLRLANRLASIAKAQTWSQTTDYALRHTLAHAALAGVYAESLIRSLVDTPAYLIARVERLGEESLDEDLRHGRQAGYEPRHFGAMVAELSLRAQTHRGGGISAAQGLAVIASAVGAQQEAVAFAKLSQDSLRAVPLWASGLEGSQIAVGGIKCQVEIRTATLTAGIFLTLIRVDRVIEIWNLRDRVRIAELEGLENVTFAEVQPDGRCVWVSSETATRGRSKLIQLSLPDGALKGTIELDQPITAIRCSTDGSHIAVGTEAGRVHLVDVETHQIVGRRDVGKAIQCLRFDGAFLAALTRQRKVVYWSLPRLALEGVITLPFKSNVVDFIDRTDGLAFDATTRHAIVGGVDGTVTQINLADESASPRHLADLSGWADHVALHSNADIIVGDSTGILNFIAHDGRRPMISMRVHASNIVMVGNFETIGICVTASKSGEIGLWSYPDDGVFEKAAHGALVSELTYSFSGSRLMSMAADGSLIEWSSEGQVRQRAYICPQEFRSLRIAPDLNTILIEKDGLQRQMLSDAADSLLSVTPWPLIIQDKCLAVFSSQPGPISIAADSSLAAADGKGGVEIWDFDPPQRRLRFPGEQLAGRGALSSDGQLLVSQGPNATLWIRFLEDSTRRHGIPFGGELLTSPFATNEGVRILTYSRDTIRCISVEILQVESFWMMTMDTPIFAVVTPDGNTVVVFGAHGLIEFRRRRDGERLGGFVLRPAASVAAFSPDGRTLAIGDTGGGVQAYQLEVRRGNDHGS